MGSLRCLYPVLALWADFWKLGMLNGDEDQFLAFLFMKLLSLTMLTLKVICSCRVCFYGLFSYHLNPPGPSFYSHLESVTIRDRTQRTLLSNIATPLVRQVVIRSEYCTGK